MATPAQTSAKPPPKGAVYTRTGDHGTSSLYNGERRSKTNIVFDALGHVDELNAHIGVAVEHCKQEKVEIWERLMEIQSRLLDIGSAIATPKHSSSDAKLRKKPVSFPSFLHTRVTSLIVLSIRLQSVWLSLQSILMSWRNGSMKWTRHFLS